MTGCNGSGESCAGRLRELPGLHCRPTVPSAALVRRSSRAFKASGARGRRANLAGGIHDQKYCGRYWTACSRHSGHRNRQRAAGATEAERFGYRLCRHDPERPWRPAGRGHSGACLEQMRSTRRASSIGRRGISRGWRQAAGMTCWGQFQLRDLGAWLDRYCAANPQTKLPLALNALGREMLAHPGGKL